MSNHPQRSKHHPHDLGRAPKPPQVARARENAGLTQYQAANLIAVTLNAWQRWEQGEREMSPALWDLFNRRLREMPGAKYGLGTPKDPIDHFDPATGLTVQVGFGWKLADAIEDDMHVELLMAPSGATRASVQIIQPRSAVGTGRWCETAESAIAWLLTEHNSPAVKGAVVQAEHRFPRLRDLNPMRVGRKNWSLDYGDTADSRTVILLINGEPRLSGAGPTQRAALEHLLDSATVASLAFGDDDRDFIRLRLEKLRE